jgi:hypothetical protein
MKVVVVKENHYTASSPDVYREIPLKIKILMR